MEIRSFHHVFNTGREGTVSRGKGKRSSEKKWCRSDCEKDPPKENDDLRAIPTYKYRGEKPWNEVQKNKQWTKRKGKETRRKKTTNSKRRGAHSTHALTQTHQT